MLRRLFSHLTYANVMSTLAVFLVIVGGGVALASVSGTGRVKFGADRGLGSGYTTVLSVKGVGQVQAACNGNVLTLGWRNTTSQQQVAWADRPAQDVHISIMLDPGLTPLATVGDSEGLRMHIFRGTGADRPAADVVITALPNASGCGDDHVAAGAVSSEP